MDSIDYYYEVPYKSTLSDKLLWAIRADTTNWTPLYGFNAKLVPQEWIMGDPFLAKLNAIHSFQAAVINLDANTCYRWHIDVDRAVSINMLLSYDHNSYCVFRGETDELVYPILKLDYKPDTYYLFNVKKHHTVFNFDKPRYVFSTQFDNLKLTYQDIMTAITDINTELV